MFAGSLQAHASIHRVSYLDLIDYRILLGVPAMGSRETCEEPLSFTKNQSVTCVSSCRTANQFRTMRPEFRGIWAHKKSPKVEKTRYFSPSLAKTRYCKIKRNVLPTGIVGIQLQ